MGEGTAITDDMVKDFDEVSPLGSWNVFFQAGDDFDHHPVEFNNWAQAAQVAEGLKQNNEAIDLIGATFHSTDGAINIQTFFDFESGDRWAELGSGKVHVRSKKMPITRLGQEKIAYADDELIAEWAGNNVELGLFKTDNLGTFKSYKAVLNILENKAPDVYSPYDDPTKLFAEGLGWRFDRYGVGFLATRIIEEKKGIALAACIDWASELGLYRV